MVGKFLDHMRSIINKYSLLLLAIIGAITVVYATITQSVWYDESLSLMFSNWSIKDSFHLTSTSDLQQPLYYIFIHFFGETIYGARAWSLIFYILSGIFLWKFLIRNEILSNKNTFLIGLFFLSPFMIFYASEIRPYMLLVFVTIGNLYFFEKLLSSDSLKKDEVKTILLFSLFSIFGAYTFYLFVLLLIGEFLYVLIFNRNKLFVFFISGMIIVIAYMPWIIVGIVNRLNENPSHFLKIPWWQIPIIILIGFGGGRVTITDVNHLKEYWPTVIVASVYSLAIISSIKYIFSGEKAKSLIVRMFFIGGVPLVMSLIISALKFSIFDPRYYIYLFPVFIIVIIGGCNYLLNTSKKFGTLVFGLLLFSNIIVLSLYLFNPWHQREPWKYVVPKVEQEILAGDYMTFYDGAILPAYQLYQKKQINFVSAFNSIEQIDKELVSANRVWFSEFLEWQRDPDHNLRSYLEQKYKYVKTIGFFKVKFNLYEKK